MSQNGSRISCTVIQSSFSICKVAPGRTMWLKSADLSELVGACMGVADPEYSVRRLADDQFAIEARWRTGKAKLLAGSFARQADATRFVSRLGSKPAALARAEIAESDSDTGYTVDFFAFKHGFTLEQASQLIREVGNSRKKLDEAATALARP